MPVHGHIRIDIPVSHYLVTAWFHIKLPGCCIGTCSGHKLFTGGQELRITHITWSIAFPGPCCRELGVGNFYSCRTCFSANGKVKWILVSISCCEGDLTESGTIRATVKLNPEDHTATGGNREWNIVRTEW